MELASLGATAWQSLSHIKYQVPFNDDLTKRDQHIEKGRMCEIHNDSVSMSTG